MSTCPKISWHKDTVAYCEQRPYGRSEDSPHQCIECEVWVGVDVCYAVQEASKYGVLSGSECQYANSLAQDPQYCSSAIFDDFGTKRRAPADSSSVSSCK